MLIIFHRTHVNSRALEEITLLAPVEKIGEYMFFRCDKLQHIYNRNPTPQEIFAIHRKPSQITLHVPAKSVEAYRDAPNWQDMNIVAIDGIEQRVISQLAQNQQISKLCAGIISFESTVLRMD